VPKDDLLARAQEMADAVAAQAPGAVATIKRIVREGADAPLPTALSLEQDATARLIVSDDAREGIAAFIEKRPPSFGGAR
jgi:enoyl-CoA hydratase/carnithine racemase